VELYNDWTEGKESNGNGLKAKIYAGISLEALRKIMITSVSGARGSVVG
jgi:hypothetical protein